MNNLIKTDIKWIPEINSSWKLGRVKDLFYISKELSTKTNPMILSLARSAVKVRDISNNEGQLAASYDNYNSVQVGDLLLNPMDLYSGANCNVSYVEGVISPAYANLRAKVRLIPRYYDYFFKVQYWTMAMFAHGKGVSFDNRWTLNAEGLLNYEVPVLPYDVQQKIVETLDKKISQIDALISNQEKKIDKLTEYKYSTIRRLISKGLDQNAKLKNSGIDELGDIPFDWEMIYTKKIFTIIAGGTPDSGDISNYDEDIIWVTPADYKTEDIYINKGRRNLSQKGYDSCSATLVPENSIIFSKRAPIGSVGITAKPLCTNQGCLSCVNDKMTLNIKFYYYVMSILTNTYELLGSGTTFKEISAKNFGSVKLPVPKYETQNLIVEALDKKCEQIDRLILIKQSKIKELQDYKKSIIYEYVTGKKEVI